MISKQVISSKVAIGCLLFLLLFLGNLKYKQWASQQLIEKEKRNLLAQTDSLEKKNNELSRSLQYLNSPSFKERVAREQLNLKKDGEAVYNFSDAPATTSAQNESLAGASNPKKWWSYFFTN